MKIRFLVAISVAVMSFAEPVAHESLISDSHSQGSLKHVQAP